MASKSRLARRFQPFLGQAQTEADIRYGGQQSALNTLLESVLRQGSQNLSALDTQNREIIGSLKAGSGMLDQAYANAGLDAATRASIANSPTGQRIAAELARGQGQMLQQQQSQQAGYQFLQQHARDQLQQDVGKIQDQSLALQRERGLFTQSMLDQLISGDRAARHEANQQVRQQQFQAQQNQADNLNSTINTLLGQGLQASVGKDGRIQIGGPLPGGKLDPSSPLNRNKNKPKRATPDAQSSAESSFGGSIDNAAAMAQRGFSIGDIAKALTKGRSAKPGQTVYEDVPVLDQFGKPTGRKKRQPKIDPKTGTVVTTGGSEAVSGIDSAVAQAVAEQVVNGYVTSRTVQHLHRLGYTVRDFPGLKTEIDSRRERQSKQRSQPQMTSPYAPGAVGTGSIH